MALYFPVEVMWPEERHSAVDSTSPTIMLMRSSDELQSQNTGAKCMRTRLKRAHKKPAARTSWSIVTQKPRVIHLNWHMEKTLKFVINVQVYHTLNGDSLVYYTHSYFLTSISYFQWTVSCHLIVQHYKHILWHLIIIIPR